MYVVAWIHFATQTAGLLLVLWGSYLAIRSLVPQMLEHYSSLVERSLVGVYLVQDGIILFVNPRVAEIFGYDRSAMIGKPLLDFVAPDSRSIVIENIRKRINGELDTLHYELQGMAKGGHLIDLEAYGSRTIHRGRAAVHGTLLDITRRKHAESQLMQSYGRYRSLMEQSAEGIWRCEFREPMDTNLPLADQVETLFKESRLVECNGVLAGMYGFQTIEEAVGKTPADLYDRDQRFPEYLEQFVRSGYRLSDAEILLRTRDGAIGYSLLNLIGYVDRQRLVHVWGIQRDITQLRETQIALSRLARDVAPGVDDEFFETVVEHLAEALKVNLAFVGLLSEDGRCITTRAIHGSVPRGSLTYELKGSASELVVGKTTYCCPDAARMVFGNDQLLKDMSAESFIGAPLNDRRGEPMGLIAAMDARPMKDVEFKKTLIEVFALRTAGEIHRTNAEEALRQSEQKYRGLFENSLTANYISTPDGRLLGCNESFARLYGFDSVEEAMALRAEDVYVDRWERQDFVNLIMEKKRLEQYESTYVRKDGQAIHVVENAVGVFDAEGQLLQIQGTLLDITERKRMEEQLLQSQKIESLGILAGGIAHDFNNLLTVINTNLFLAESAVEPGHPVLVPLNEIRTTVKRAVSLTGQILAFGRKQVMERKHHELDTIVHEFGVTLRRIVEEDIQITLSVNSTGSVVHCDRGQIEQILLNLCVNARDAMEKGGTIGIRTYKTILDADFCAHHQWAREGCFVCLEVSDDGCGIDEAVLEKIFDPFFTTKEVGKGSGMGLAVVYGIIKAHQGLLDVRSTPGRGSVFSAYLPVVEQARPDNDHSGGTVPKALRGTETILLVEDNNQIRDVTSMILTEYGYTVLTANNGEEALTIVGHADNQVDLVFTDMVMPRMGGHELYNRLTTMKPDMKFLFTSGYTFVAQDMEFIHRKSLSFLQKPYELETLLLTIRKVVESA